MACREPKADHTGASIGWFSGRGPERSRSVRPIAVDDARNPVAPYRLAVRRPSEVSVAVPRILARERIVARPGFNRWLIPPAALAVHLCIGQAYATSVYKAALVKHFDTSLTAIGSIFSIAIVMLGLSAAVFGTWVDRNGPRAAMFTSACFWVAGFLVGSLGIATGQLWLIYLGYGVIGGIGLGIGYISPVSTLIKWFPDRPGMATGMAIMGFGGGALIGAPLARNLMDYFRSNFDLGVEKTFLVMGAIYFVAMMFGVFTIRVPQEGWKPEGWVAPARPNAL